jgi:hypothetical protein
MVTLLVEVVLPACVLLAVLFAASLYRKLKYPSPLAMGCIIPKVCVVGAVEILRYNKKDKSEDEQSVAKHLRREVLWKQLKVNWGYLCEEAWNTTLFQRAVRFEKMKIDPTKSALQYEQREILILELVDQTDEMRWTLFRAQATLLFRTALRLSIDQEIFITVLAQYKKLEEDIVALAGMAEDDCYREMLMERLGLNNWGLIEGGSPEPA